MSSDPVDIRLLGASTYLSDNTDVIQTAIDSGHPVYIPYGGSTDATFKFGRRLKLHPGTVIRGDGRMSSILEFTGSGIAIDDVDYGPATRSILSGFKLQASDTKSTIGIQMTNAKIVVLENLWIEGRGWSKAGISILGGQGTDYNTYAYRILGCDISGCKGDGIFIKDDAGTGGLYVSHSHIQGCGGIGFNQVFGSNGPGYKCQVYVEGNDIEGNAGGQINCDSLCGSTFKDNHLENQGLPANPCIAIPEACKVPPMRFGSRISGITAGGKTWHGQFFGLNIIGNNINSVYSKWAIEFSSTSGSIGIIVQGNNIVGPTNRWTKRSGKWKKVASGWNKVLPNKWENRCEGESPKYADEASVPVIESEEAQAAIVSHPQLNLVILGNSCRGIFEGYDYAGYGGGLFTSSPFLGQDTEGHHFRGDLRFGITTITETVSWNNTSLDYINTYGRSSSFHFKSNNPITFPLPIHKVGKRLLFKNIGVAAVTLISTEGTIDGSPKPYGLAKYAFVELEDDGTDYWIVGSGTGDAT